MLRPTHALHPLRHCRRPPPISRRLHAGGAYGFKQAVADINLKWTVPVGLGLTIGLWFYLQHQIDSQPPSSAPAPLRIDEPLPPSIVLKQPAQEHLVDPATQTQLPAELSPHHIALQEPLRLVGLGVRTVSFLAIKVYVAGFYADPRVLRALRVVPGWSDDFTTEKLLSPPLDPPHKDQQQDIRGEALIRNLLAAPAHFAIRIAPVRPTDFTHLRDGFCRSLTARIKRASQAGTLSEFDLERASQSIATFRSFFPTGVSVPKGKALTMIRTASQTLVVEYDGKKLGELDDRIVARELFLAYFADQDPISSKLKESVADGFATLYAPASGLTPSAS
ncbi:hypothetical protein PTTG_27921 [Puccinia triticina 1-1 BBBD Race 1]|uniref:Chalcone_isomerase domain-containing protein n=2 Tax=Puccinia triticina TaxID=208348 RepID=A0A180GHZ6_PUCT1|nr:uncharacterized protein PtA15_1A212 [Puccinia triticina]OAV91583.1 hypothetical protein PTTG_27921 [Puccinia triticina 1-1 BBBD Race 1]WAQ80874.1 hypothetical protein PtA15_1A212 [Puccinia triticina]WAR51768.1 hypothetical protein PtB15_1B204 [Puccinia triticina]